MNWEAVTAVGTVTTTIVIALTVVFASRQLTHLRRATQLEGMMEMRNDFQRPAYKAAMQFVLNDLGFKLRDDPEFRKGVELIGGAPEEVHQELVILREFETVGGWVRHGLLDDDVVLDLYLPLIILSWLRLRDVVEVHRRVAGDALWENFEFLYDSALRYGMRHTPGNVEKIKANWEKQRAEVDSGGPGPVRVADPE